MQQPCFTDEDVEAPKDYFACIRPLSQKIQKERSERVSTLTLCIIQQTLSVLGKPELRFGVSVEGFVQVGSWNSGLSSTWELLRNVNPLFYSRHIESITLGVEFQQVVCLIQIAAIVSAPLVKKQSLRKTKQIAHIPRTELGFEMRSVFP